MTPLVVGTATPSTPDDTLWEMRLFEDDEHAVTFLNSSFKRLDVDDHAHQIPYAEGELSVDAELHVPRLVKQGARMEILAGNEAPQDRLFVGVIDYVTTDAEKGKTTIHFQARGLAASLVDARFQGQIGDTLQAAVETLTSAAGLRAEVVHPEAALVVWVRAQSSYAVLRLIAANLGAIIRTHDDVVEFISGEAYLERVRKAPHAKIVPTDIRSSHTEQGHPVRRRT